MTSEAPSEARLFYLKAKELLLQKVPLSQDEFALFMQAWQKTARVDQVRSLLSLATRGKPIEDDVVGFARRLPAMRGYVITDPDALRLRVLVEHGEEMGLTGDDMRGILRDGATALGKSPADIVPELAPFMAGRSIDAGAGRA